jgi:hypothetical protein
METYNSFLKMQYSMLEILYQEREQLRQKIVEFNAAQCHSFLLIQTIGLVMCTKYY